MEKKLNYKRNMLKTNQTKFYYTPADLFIALSQYFKKADPLKRYNDRNTPVYKT